MNKICPICGHSGEVTWRDGKYYCAMCGHEIDETTPNVPDAPQVPMGAIAVDVTCPICKNSNGNTMQGGKCVCSLCGTTFDMPRISSSEPEQHNSYNSGYSYSQSRLKELESDKNKKTIWGIVCVFLFWPASIYFFYKAYKIGQEIKSIRGW